MRLDRRAEMKHDAVRLVQLADEAADLRAQDALQRLRFRGDDVHLDPARAQRGRDLEADEARADDHARAWPTPRLRTIARLSANVRR